MSKIFLYNHGGSGNHGCEALVRTISAFFSKNTRLSVLSEMPQQDYYYNMERIINIEPAEEVFSKFSYEFIKAYIKLKKSGNYFLMDCLPYLKAIKKLKEGDVEISIGGDIYCYKDYPKFIKLHELICKKGCKSILLGCSLEEKLFNDPQFIEDMKRYNYISAREMLTYNMLKKAGIENVDYNPDTAFVLPVEEVVLPSEFVSGNMIGINLSPLVVQKENVSGIVIENFINLIQWILKNTDCGIALIPHVVWKNNDDRTILNELLENFREEKRVILIEDNNCMQLKGYISQCRFFVGSRTHATIAAYSTCVPTLVLGYSIKSKGIARDLFGTDENYVVSIENLQRVDDMQKAFQWIWEHELQIRKSLKSIMPEYVGRINNIKMKIEGVIGSEI